MSESPMSRFVDEVPAVADLGTVHLVGVGGAGMSVVARLLRSRGVDVQGSDARGGAVLDALEADGVRVWVGHDAAHVEGASTLVVSSAVRESNPELAAARAAGLRVLHRSQALAALMEGSRAVAVAGAHGKTTTSAMIAVLLEGAGLAPSFAIGGSVRTADGALAGGHLGSGDVLVAEADESDGSFLNYRPTIAVVTNVEPDHLDNYGTTEAFERAFVEFAARVRPGGCLVACLDDDGARRLVDVHRAAGGQVVTYGTSADADVRVERYAPSGDGSTATLVVAGVGGSVGSAPVALRVPGEHNMLDAAGAVAVALLLGVPLVTAVEAVGAFVGTGRRFEDRGTAGGVRVVDDYAHHPTEVAALVTGARPAAGEGRVLALFQPHLFSRTKTFAAEFAAALDLADVAVVTGVYAAREDDDPAVTGELITSRSTRGARYVPDKVEAARVVARLARPGDLVLTIGAGDVTELAPVVLDELRASE